jgi:ornithine decarboxylase
VTLTASRVPAPRTTARRPAASTPLLTVDLATVRSSYDDLARALPGVGLHYAVKANPSPQVLRTLAQAGARWDVASPGEIDLVLAVDPDPSHISYGNTVKKAADIAYAFERGVRTFTLDSERELDKLHEHAPGAELLVRITTSGRGADWALGTKFGCGEVEARRLLLRAVRLGHPVGVCFHVGSQQRDVHAWDEPLATTARLRDAVRRVGADLSTVDLGGGFPAHTSVPTLPIEAYGLAIVDALVEHLGPDLPRLIAEPGRSLVADAGELETEVVLVTRRGGARWVFLDCGLFGGLAETLGEAIRYRMSAYRDGVRLEGPVSGVVLAGPTCDSADVLYLKHRPLLPLDLRDGDRVVLHAAGAYTTAYSSVGFNGFAPLREVDR